MLEHTYICKFCLQIYCANDELVTMNKICIGNGYTGSKYVNKLLMESNWQHLVKQVGVEYL